MILPNIKLGENIMTKMALAVINERQEKIYNDIIKNEKLFSNEADESYADVTNYKDLIRIETWEEEWTNLGAEIKKISIKAVIWSEAIQIALKEHQNVYIPYFENPIYIDKPIVLRSNNTLKVHPKTEIRLRPYTNTCMIRNENIVSGKDGIVNSIPDENIEIQGGIWTTLANGQIGRNGNIRGNADQDASVYAAHGVILLHNVKKIKVSYLTIKESAAFGIHIGNGEGFLIENIYFIDNRRDGVHINGPAKNGIIRNIEGNTGDDIIAINAWDWKDYSISFGSITDILVENVSAYSNEIRLLAGEKKFDNGEKATCDIKRCIFKDISGVYNFKIYCQPNIEALLKGEIDRSEKVGNLEDIYFDGIDVKGPLKSGLHGVPVGGVFEICADIEKIAIKNLKLRYSDINDFVPVCIGPMSFTWKNDFVDGRVIEGENSEKWQELFDPDMNCNIKNMLLKNIFVNETGKLKKITNKDEIIKVKRQKINKDYPNTTPKGGSGKAEVSELLIV